MGGRARQQQGTPALLGCLWVPEGSWQNQAQFLLRRLVFTSVLCETILGQQCWLVPLCHSLGTTLAPFPRAFWGWAESCCCKGDHGWARDAELSHAELASALFHGDHSNLYQGEDTGQVISRGAVPVSGGICQLLRICVQFAAAQKRLQEEEKEGEVVLQGRLWLC